jgi:hypothetical protein
MRKGIKIVGILVVVLILGFIAREYWRHLNYTKSYDECVQKFRTTEIEPGIHRCKVPFLGREFFFDEQRG